MRVQLTALIIALAFLNVTAKVRGQQVTLNVKNTSIDKVFDAIKKQTGYQFWYEDQLLKKSKAVTVNLKGASITDALDAVIEGQSLQYTITDKTVVVKAKPKSFIERVIESFKLIDVNGKVNDENNQPLIGASIKVKGTNKQTSTNKNGEFYLEKIADEAIIEISFLGYVTQEVKARTNITVAMQPLQNELQEVTINKGYYRTTKELNTGSVSTVTSESLGRQPVGDPILALHGQVPGLYIAQETGTQGTPSTVRLRGTNSIANGNNPLYIIDGVPFSSEFATSISAQGAGISISPFSTIGMENIESIDVLKDADATAIYGSRGANGVILISTKKGKAGKTTLNANFNHGFGRIVNGYNLMNTQEYLEMRREAFANDNRTPIATSYDVNGTWDQNNYTDWEDVLIGGTAKLTNASMNISGGNELTQFLVNGSYRNETTVYPGNYRDRKFSIQSNITNQSPNKRLSSSFNFLYTNDDNRLPTNDLTTQIVLSPNTPSIYKSDGSLNWENNTWNNPLAALYNKSTAEVQNLNGSGTISYKILDGLSISSRVGYNRIDGETHNLLPAAAKNPADPITNESRRHTIGTKLTTSWIVEPSLSYTKQIGWAKIESIIGATFQDSSYEGIAFYGLGFNSDDLMDDIRAANSLQATGTSIFGKYRYNAAYGRIGITVKDRYVLNLTGRRDGSSRFGPGKQFGNFGAVAGAWLFHREKIFLNNLKWLSFGKLRASFGVTGNDQLSDYMYLSTYRATGTVYQGIGGLNPTQHTNPEFGWETVRKLEAALELGLFKDKVTLNINWYRNRTANQLVGYPLPTVTGFPTVQANLPAIVQNSGWEADVMANVISNSKLKWNISANISIPKNKLVSYPGLSASAYSNRFVIGMPITIVQRYHYTGLDKQTGLFTFQDKNGDKAITSAADRYPVFAGQKFFGGISNAISYKGFELNILLQFVKQTGTELGPFTSPGFYFTGSGNLPRTYLDRWRQVGDETKYQKVTQVSGSPAATAYSLYRESDGLISDRSFIRLRNVALAWNMPSTLTKKIGLANLKAFAQAQNLFTITKFKGADPEMTATNYALPPLRMITTGVQLSFN